MPISIEKLFESLNEWWYVDDDIWCEDNTDITNACNAVLKKTKNEWEAAKKIRDALQSANYLVEWTEDIVRGFIHAFLVWYPQVK